MTLALHLAAALAALLWLATSVFTASHIPWRLLRWSERARGVAHTLFALPIDLWLIAAACREARNTDWNA